MTNGNLSARINTAVGTAGVAQLVEQLICNQQAGGSSPSTSSTSSSFYLGEFQSGQMGQTVNLLSLTSVVRIHLPPPAQKFPPPFRFRLRRKLHSGGNFFTFHRDSLRWTRGGGERSFLYPIAFEFLLHTGSKRYYACFPFFACFFRSAALDGTCWVMRI